MMSGHPPLGFQAYKDEPQNMGGLRMVNYPPPPYVVPPALGGPWEPLETTPVSVWLWLTPWGGG